MRIALQKQSQQPVFSTSAGSNTAALRSNRHPGSSTGHGLSSIPAFAVFGQVPKAMLSKTAISTSGERDEQKADAAAERVMRMRENVPGGALVPSQRANATMGIDGRVESEARALHGSGSPLPHSARAFFESRFQHNFAAVRVHTDARAARLARDANAQAFTLGPNIVFSSGAYAPETGEGKRIMAHELAHVVQQEQMQPHIQRLTITTRKGHLWQGECGAYEVDWAFRLDKPAPDDGYIVQQIDRNEWTGDCPAQGAPAPLPSYWEAWFVEKGHKRDVGTIASGITDSSTLRTPMPGTSGMLSSAGTVKFFTASTTGDLEVNWRAWTPGPFGWLQDRLFPPGGKVPESGDLPSTDVQPTWWNNAPVEGPAGRSVAVSWTCCDADEAKHTTHVAATP